jgi:outer membrane autotransporter protein
MASVFISCVTAGAGRRRTLRRLLVSAAVVPLMQAAAHAETTISTAVTMPVSTATAASGAPDDLTITSAGSITPTVAGAAVTRDSNNSVTSSGTISFTGLNDTVGILGLGGFTGTIQNAGVINNIEDYTATDADSDGDLDGAFASGARRYGLRVTGPAPFLGSLVNASGGVITVEGNDSAGVSVETRLEGDLIHSGGISVVGDRGVGLQAPSVAGKVRIDGPVSVQGEGSSAVVLGDVGGGVVLQNSITATGYRYTARAADDARAKLDADDLKQGGSAVRIHGSVGGGILLDAPPAETNADSTDDDGDGITDTLEARAILTSYGAAPALDLGGAGATSIGLVGAGEDAFGIVIKGQVIGSGVNDGVSATALRIGQPGGGATSVAGGLNLRTGLIQAAAYSADATALVLNAGASVPEIRNSGGQIFATSTTAGAHTATAVLIEAGADVRTFRNHGSLQAGIVGGAGNARGIVDRSGTLSLIENIGNIKALVSPSDGSAPTGSAIAIDLRSNTSGATVRQWAVADGDDGADGVADADADADGVDDADEPMIQGDVLLGSGDDRVELLNGSLTGFLWFGTGADAFVLDGGAQFSGGLADPDGRLAVDVRNGRLKLDRTGAVAVSSLNVGSTGVLAFTVDPKAGTAASFDVSGAATLAPGARIELDPISLSATPQSFELIRAGALTASGVTGAVVDSPYIYSATLRVDQAANRLYADLRLRTASELGFNRSESQAYDAVFGSIGRSNAVQTALAAKTNHADFTGLYDQLLPEHSGAAFQSARAVADALSMAADEDTVHGAEPGQAAFWAREIYLNVEQDRLDALGFKLNGVGLAAGLERATLSNAAYGIALGLVSTKSSEAGSEAGDRLVMNSASASLYARKSWGGLRADVSATAGAIGFDNARRIVSTAEGVDLTAKSDWFGWWGGARASLAYKLTMGWLFVKPRAELDYLRLHEGGYQEEGGGDGVDLDVDSRSSSQLTGGGSLTIGLDLGDQMRWGPQVTVGRRERLSGSAGATTARFLGGGADFSLDPEAPPESTNVIRAGLKASGLGAHFLLDGGVETGDAYKQWDVRAVARFVF